MSRNVRIKIVDISLIVKYWFFSEISFFAFCAIAAKGYLSKETPFLQFDSLSRLDKK